MYYLILRSHDFYKFKKKSEVIEHLNHVLDVTCNTYDEAMQALSDYDSLVGYAECSTSLSKLLIEAQDAIITDCMRELTYDYAYDNLRGVQDEILELNLSHNQFVRINAILGNFEKELKKRWTERIKGK